MNFIKDYYLLIDQIIDLPSPKRNLIMDMYRDMLHRLGDKSCEGMVQSYFNTLEMGGYIKNRTITERENKLGELIDERS
jgi:hypothetical protein